MAVTKIWAIHDSVSRVVDYCTNPSKTKLSDLEQVLLYAADKEKTLDEGEQQYAVTGIGCRAESAAREMAAVQRRFGKAGGNVHRPLLARNDNVFYLCQLQSAALIPQGGAAAEHIQKFDFLCHELLVLSFN